jgi:hypothetical protein
MLEEWHRRLIFRNDDVDRACAILSCLAPDAAQRPFDGALLSRGPCCGIVPCGPWGAANYSAIPPAAPVDLPATIRFNEPVEVSGDEGVETSSGPGAAGLHSTTCVKLSGMLFA